MRTENSENCAGRAHERYTPARMHRNARGDERIEPRGACEVVGMNDLHMRSHTLENVRPILKQTERSWPGSGETTSGVSGGTVDGEARILAKMAQPISMGSRRKGQDKSTSNVSHAAWPPGGDTRTGAQKRKLFAAPRQR